jgi:hypothetical protein|tara:strand:+ start:321 stop:581 length:261 start_codon:yes stop_codon:yes gene_type:complete
MKTIIRKVLNEYSIEEDKKNLNEFDWDEVLKDQNQGRSPNKWNSLERELSNCIEPLIEKYTTEFGNDSYGVIDAIYQIMDGMFQKK